MPVGGKLKKAPTGLRSNWNLPDVRDATGDVDMGDL